MDFMRWDKFSQRSDKYCLPGIFVILGIASEDYDYSIGSLVYIAKEDDEAFEVHPKKPHVRLLYEKPAEKITIRNLVKQCKRKGIKGYLRYTKYSKAA